MVDYICVNRKELLDCLGNFINVNDEMFISSDDGRLIFSMGDSSLHVSSSIEVSGVLGSPICISAPKLCKLVAELPDDEVCFSVEGGYFNINCTSGIYRFMVDGNTAPKNYPFDGDVFVVDSDVLRQSLITTSAVSCATKGRQIYENLFIELSDGLFTVIGSDCRRLARVSFAIDNTVEKSMIITPVVVNHLIKTLPFALDVLYVIEVTFDDYFISFRYLDTLITSSLHHDVFTEFEKSVPIGDCTNVTVNRDELLGVIKAASIFTEPFNHRITLDVCDFGIQVIVKDDGVIVSKNIVSIDSFEGSGLSIELNAEFLGSLISKAGSECLTLSFYGDEIAVKIFSERDFFLCMPLIFGNSNH